jgi:Protein of unknown function (DUF1592)/Protein of unknown function (DUF1588)/Protein of unknown function (DUF1595)/Protein of unknown function (DUF1585)/Protein of unknown function (DUF1587)
MDLRHARSFSIPCLPARTSAGLSLGLAFLVGCSGSMVGDGDKGGKGGDSGGGGQAGGDVPAGPHSLERKLDKPLVCNDSSALNVSVSPFSRLTTGQYIRSLRDLVAPVKLDDNLGLDLPVEASDKAGFLNNWESQTVEAKVVEQYELISRNVAAKVVAGLSTLGIAACVAPKDATGETACGAAFIDEFGSRAYRRPLSTEERQRLRALFDSSYKSWGLSDALSLLSSVIFSSPQFLYRIEEGGDDGDGRLKLTGHEVATRLSYLIWGTTPDKALMDLAASGALDTSEGLQDEALRMLGDPRASTGLSDFSGQWLRFNKLAVDLSASKKDLKRFTDYNDAAATASFSGLRRFVEASLFGDEGGIQTLLSSNKAWVNSASASLYGPDVKATGTALTEVALDPEQRRGFLTQAAVMAGFAHETVQAPVQRGVFVLEHLLCSPPPPPPPNVAPAPVAEATDVETTREKFVRAHEGQTACRSCHQRIDAVGFTFENYNAVGRWQTTEPIAGGKTLPIDSSGAITDTFDADGTFDNAVQLIDKLVPSEQVAQCFVTNFYQYALARELVEEDGCSIAATTDQVIDSKGSFASLLKAAVKSNQFRFRVPFLQ